MDGPKRVQSGAGADFIDDVSLRGAGPVDLLAVALQTAPAAEAVGRLDLQKPSGAAAVVRISSPKSQVRRPLIYARASGSGLGLRSVNQVDAPSSNRLKTPSVFNTVICVS